MNRELSPVDIKLEGIGHVLRDRRLRVPPYQRQYSWETEEVSDFWWDLKSATSARTPQYFLGSIVLTRSGASLESSIVDGQQRLTTTSLLFLAIRNEFLRRGETSRATVIESEYGIARDLRSGQQVTRLILNEDDQRIYEEIVNFRPTSANSFNELADGTSRLAIAMRFLEDRVREEAKDAGRNWAESLFRWIEFIEQRARVISVSVGDESDAFLVFETLNARGRALTVADLLKNYLFGLAGSDLNVLQGHWMSAIRTLEASANEEIFTTYLRQLWSSLKGLTRERELYAQLKASITAKNDALKFGREIEEAAGTYAAVLSSDQPYWADRLELKPYCETMLRLGLEQNRPMLLAAMRRFGNDELTDLFRAAISWSIRGIIVGGLGGGTTERAYAEAAVAISEGRARNAIEVFSELTSIVPTDESFRQSFLARRIPRTKIAKYILVALARFEARADGAAIVSDSIESGFQLRSIIPRNADPEQWPSFDAEELSQWSFRLGNMFVVDSSSSGKRSPDFGHAQVSVWTPAAIAARQAALADAAVQLWPRKP